MKVRAQITQSFRALILSSFPLSLSDPFELDGNSIHGIVPARTRGAQTKRVPSRSTRTWIEIEMSDVVRIGQRF